MQSCALCHHLDGTYCIVNQGLVSFLRRVAPGLLLKANGSVCHEVAALVLAQWQHGTESNVLDRPIDALWRQPHPAKHQRKGDQQLPLAAELSMTAAADC